MKVKKTVIFFICFFSLLTTSVQTDFHAAAADTRPDAKVNYTSYSGFTVPDDPVLPKVEAHPKLWFDSAQIKSVYDKRGTDAYAKQLWSISAEPVHNGRDPGSAGLLHGS